MKVLALAAVAALLLPSPGLARVHTSVNFDDDEGRVVRSLTRDIPATGARSVRLELAPGSLSIVASPDGQVHVKLELVCNGDDDCDEDASDVRLVTELETRQLRLSVEGFSGINTHGLHMRGQVQVPRDRAVEIELAAGELKIEGLEGDVDVDMKAGELSVRMPQRSVRSVQLRGMIGESRLVVDGHSYEHDGIFGHRVRWSEGTGAARVTTNVMVGETHVRLD